MKNLFVAIALIGLTGCAFSAGVEVQETIPVCVDCQDNCDCGTDACKCDGSQLL